jgi:hypothetical protein
MRNSNNPIAKAAAAAATVLALLLFNLSPAFADDEPAPLVDSSVSQPAAPSPEAAPLAEDPAPAEVIDEAPAPEVAAPVEEVVVDSAPTQTDSPAQSEPASNPEADEVTTDTLPAPPTKPKYHLLAWLVPGGPDSVFEPDQTLVDHVLTDTASLDLLDNSSTLVCGSYYQMDLENNSAITDSLVAGGILYGPNDPNEDHAYGALGDGVYPWKYLQTPDCVEVVAPTASVSGECSPERPAISVSGSAGTAETAFKLKLDGVIDEAYTEVVAAGGTFTGSVILDEDSYDGSVTVQVFAGETALTEVVTVSTDCEETVDTPLTPLGPVFGDCTVTVPGNLVRDSGIRYDEEIGGTLRVLVYDVVNGTYYVSETVVNGAREFVVDFVANPGFVITEPRPGVDEYDLVRLAGGATYATWVKEYTSEDCNPTPPPVVDPPVDTPKVDTPSVTPAGNTPVVNKLAYTGSTVGISLLIAAFSLVLVGAVAVMRRRIFGFMRFIVRSGRHSATA